jgi:hypothetical protein
MTSPLSVELINREGKITAVFGIPEDVFWRMARRVQGDALREGFAGPCTATLSILPQRSQPNLAGGLEIRLVGDAPAGENHGEISSFHFVTRLPVSALNPVIAGIVSPRLASTGQGGSGPISYAILCQRDGSEGCIWAGSLAPFVTTVAVRPETVPAAFTNYESAADVPVLAHQDVLDDCAAWCRDGAIEKGGALLGLLRQSQDPSAGGIWSEILGFAPASGAVANAEQIIFSAEAWRNIEVCRISLTQKLGLESPLQVVGWAHGHPRLEEAGGNPFFLSYRDAAVMAQHFAEPYAVALVLDAQAGPTTPANSMMVAYGWDEYGVDLTPRSIGLLDPVRQNTLLQEVQP